MTPFGLIRRLLRLLSGLGMAMGIGPDPNSWISIRFHGFGSEKYRPVIFGSDPDPFKFHGSESGSEKNTQTRTRESGGPVLFIFYFFYIKYILKLEFGERVLGIWEEHEYMMNRPNQTPGQAEKQSLMQARSGRAVPKCGPKSSGPNP